MYSYVSQATVKPIKAKNRAAFESVQKALAARNLRPTITFIGSGPKNLVTRWEQEPYDLDYNFVFDRLPEEFRADPRKLKDTVRAALDEALKKEDFSYGQDSTSAITYNHRTGGQLDFRLDIAILMKDEKGNYHRLIVDKHLGRCLWNEAREMQGVTKRARRIHEARRWNDLRERYLALKNQYGKRSDVPSFSVYAEAVNLVFQSIPKEERPEEADS